ncbi:uncharacterized protein LOC109604701 [Aethina tumida]|uniref:uncharacterized protein LOC109604701 n=1 Tax=Aethina tumida TaxID=116153 RepID=UPI002148D0A4|nr:uncharacterized protein LOC109604701 [Aethina tumida]
MGNCCSKPPESIHKNKTYLSRYKIKLNKTASTKIEHEEWYHGNISRKTALNLLKNEEIGTFLVRKSKGAYIITFKEPDVCFKTIGEVVEHYKDKIGLEHPYLNSNDSQSMASLHYLDDEGKMHVIKRKFDVNDAHLGHVELNYTKNA